MNKTFDEIVQNLRNDIDKSTNKEINKIYDELQKCLKDFDRDGIRKNIKDWFSRLFMHKKEKCFNFLKDILDSKDKLSDSERAALLKRLKNIADIKRGFVEDIIRFLGLM